MRISFIFCLILICGLATSIKARATPSRSEFFNEIQEHRARVKTLALKIFKHHSDLFPFLQATSPELRTLFVDTYLSTHDKPKVMTLETLKKYGYRGERTLFDKLHENWGKALKRHSGPPPFIQELNKVEAEYKIQVMSEAFSGMDPVLFERLLQEVKYMEYIADETDTKITRGPELGADFKPFDGEEMFRTVYKDLKGAEISRWLEMRYYKRAALSCERLFTDSSFDSSH